MLAKEICNVDLLTEEQLKKWVKSFNTSEETDVFILFF